MEKQVMSKVAYDPHLFSRSRMSGSVSFTVRRPSPVSRGDSDTEAFKVPSLPQRLGLANNNSGTSSPLSRGTSPNTAVPRPKPSARTYEQRDSSDEEDEAADELITGFDQFGVQRLNAKKAPEGPLVIAPLANRDWREAARARRGGGAAGERFIPGAGAVATGADGSVGGLGTRDAINSGPQLSGLQKLAKRQKREDEDEPMAVDDAQASVKSEEKESEDQRALRILLSGADGEPTDELAPIIPQLTRTLSEAEALKQDVEVLPEQASLYDYERVPVAQFGAAMLRGMGWTEGTAANKSGRPDAKLWLPERRTALLGIGAKEREVLDDGDPRKKKLGKPSMKYMPVLKKEKEGSSRDVARNGDDRDGRSSTRDRDDRDRRREDDRDRPRRDDNRDRPRRDDRERDRPGDYDDKRSSHRDGDGREERRRDRDRDYDRKRDDDRRRDDRDRDRNRERSPNRDSRRDRERDDSRRR